VVEEMVVITVDPHPLMQEKLIWVLVEVDLIIEMVMLEEAELL
tara:strand:+ start:386 stop:514 length:129 start_codon:yes stop_codon:yes gene_type:complete